MELVHASSLILDDLPSWTMRRCGAGGRRTTWCSARRSRSSRRSACSNLAFGAVARRYEPPLAAPPRRRWSRTRSGLAGLIGGQAADLLATDQQHRLRAARAHPSRQDRRAVQRRGDRGRADRRRRASRSRRCGLRQEPRARVPDHRRPARRRRAIRPIPARRSAKTLRKTTFVSFSGVAGARQLAAELCQTADARSRRSAARADRLRELSAFVAGQHEC